jgi:hypothetical protein
MSDYEGVWMPISCAEREELIDRLGRSYNGFSGESGIGVLSSKTDLDGEYGRAEVFTEWGYRGTEVPVLRDIRYTKDDAPCEHYAFVPAAPVADTTETPSGITAIVCYTKCWPCNFNQHPVGVHDWANAATTGQPDPAGQVCGCWCAGGPVLDPQPDEPDWVEVRYRDEPCVTCGEVGACGYDAEGRALIHVTEESNDD